MGIRDTGGTHCLKPWISCETGAAAFYIRSNLFLLPDRIHNIEGGGSITSSSEPSPCHRQRRGSIHGTHLLSGRWRIEVLGIGCHGVGRPVRFTPVPIVSRPEPGCQRSERLLPARQVKDQKLCKSLSLQSLIFGPNTGDTRAVLRTPGSLRVRN